LRRSSAGGLLFFCVRRKEAKEDHICSNTIHKKETTANRQSLPAHNIFSPYTLFGWVREGTFPGEKSPPACTAITHPAITTPHLCKTCSKNVCILPEANQEKERSSTGQFSIGLGKEEKCVKMLCGLKNALRVVWIGLGINGDVFLQHISLRHAGK